MGQSKSVIITQTVIASLEVLPAPSPLRPGFEPFEMPRLPEVSEPAEMRAGRTIWVPSRDIVVKQCVQLLS